LGSAGILPALFGILPDKFNATFVRSRRQNADGGGQNARAPPKIQKNVRSHI
jgi:hypothetical protein